MTRSSRQHVLVCFADPSESGALRKLRPDLRILHTGMGTGNTSRALHTYLGTARPDLIVSSGFAGGLRPNLGTGCLVWEPGPHASSVPLTIPSSAKKGSFHHSSQIVITASEKDALWKETERDAVEMESKAIHEIAKREKIPSLTLRIISDPANEDLPLDFNRTMTPDMRLSYTRLAFQLAKNPSRIFPLIRFGRSVKRTARLLADAISELLPSTRSNSRNSLG